MKHLRRNRRTGGTTAGLTLVEMLVVLVLASLLGTVIVQGTGFFLGQYARVQRVQLDVNEAALFEHWFVSTVAAALPSRVETRQFVGSECPGLKRSHCSHSPPSRVARCESAGRSPGPNPAP